MSVIQVANDMGRQVTERKITLDEWRDGVASGEISEVFACGTAAVVTPIGTLKNNAGSYQVGSGESGETTLALRQKLLDIQYGRTEDAHGWLRRIL